MAVVITSLSGLLGQDFSWIIGWVVTGQESVWVGFQQHRVQALLPTVPEDAWHLQL